MAGSGDGGTPVDHGVTAGAEGSAGVTRLCAGGFLIGNSSGGMDVSGAVRGEVGLVHSCVGGIRLGIHVELLVGEGTGTAVYMSDQTHVNVHLHILGEEVVRSPVGCSSKAGNLNVGIKVDNTNRQLGQNGSAGLNIGTGAGNGDGSGVCLFRNGVFSGETVSQIHVIQLPVVDTVQVDHSGNGLDGLDGGSLQIHPVDGAEGNPVQSSVSGNQLQSGCSCAGLDLDHADDNGLVACVVADLELHTVIAVSHSGSSRHNAVCEGGCNLHAVNVNLGGIRIQAGNVGQGNLVLQCVLLDGCVCHGGREVQNVIGGSDNITLHQRRSAIQVDLVKDRVLSVVNGFGVVHGEAVQIVGVGTVDGTVGLPQDVVLGSVGNDSQEELALFSSLTSCLSVSILQVELVGILQRDLFKGTDIHGQVMPAGLVDVVVNILGFHHADGCQSIIGAVAVGVSHIVTLDPALDIVLRDIQPEAHGTGIFKNQCFTVNTQSDPGVITGVGLLGGKAVDLQTHGVVAVVNLAVGTVCQGQLQIVVTIVVGSAVDDVPLINGSLAGFKVPEDLGGLAQV